MRDDCVVKSPILLKCGCQTWTQEPEGVPYGQAWLCFDHGPTERVRDVGWSIKCQRCRYARHNLGRLTAQVRANKHTIEKGHNVEVLCWHEDEVTTRYFTVEHQMSFDDIPPF